MLPIGTIRLPHMSTPVNSQGLDTLFREAHTYSHWLPKPVPDDLLKSVYDLFKFGPTSANACPARIVFVKSVAAKERLRPTLSPQNVEKTMSAPATAIVGYDLEFYEKLPKLFPQADARSWFVGNTKMIEENAFRNGSLQGAYFILAARALGLDCGPMSGFDNAKVDAAFFPDGKWKSNFLCNIGYGDASKLYPRNPRLEFAEACRIE
jgi:3-hydroxypropanoate dehydrogenase